jgi:hypothetical protein
VYWHQFGGKKRGWDEQVPCLTQLKAPARDKKKWLISKPCFLISKKKPEFNS